MVSGPPRITDFLFEQLPCTDCKSKVSCDACKKKFPKQAWPAQDLKNQKKRGSRIVCAICKQMGVTAYDLELYSCQECQGLFGMKRFNHYALKNYKYGVNKRLVCTHCEAKTKRERHKDERAKHPQGKLALKKLRRADNVEPMRSQGLMAKTRMGRKFKGFELKYNEQASLVLPRLTTKRCRKRKARNCDDLAEEMKKRGKTHRPGVNADCVRPRCLNAHTGWFTTRKAAVVNKCGNF